ncbi:MAG: ABC transporter ATP-binding protein [Candidatus Latescibacteria bacterium]|nr:ABC transporter ATP-binding protein [Candidatus Latescibacterota bacterium]
MVPIELDPILVRPRGPRTLIRFLGWMIRTDPWRAVTSLVLEFASGLLPAAAVWFVRELFDNGVGVYQGLVPVNSMLPWLAGWASVTLAEIGLRTWSRTILLERLKQEMEDRLLEQLQMKSRSLRLDVFERADFHDLLRRAQVAATPGFFLNLLGAIYRILTGGLTVISVGIVVGYWDPYLLVAILLVSLPPPLASLYHNVHEFYLQRRQTQAQRLRGYLESILTAREDAKEVRVFRLGTILAAWWDHLYWQAADSLYRQRRRHHATGGCLSAVSLAAFAGAVGWSAWAVLAGGLSAGQFAAMLVALRQVRTGADHLVNRMSFLAIQLLNIADLFIYLDLGPEEPPGGANIATLKGKAITTKALSFRYPQTERHAINDVTMTIRPGERVALVGENGSGKTTLVKVLLGLFRPTAGDLNYGNLPANLTNRDEVWNRCTAVFQDYTRFAFTLGENIGFGHWKRMREPGEIERAAQRGGADAVAGRLPEGYETPLGREFEGATELSGGEWQRVAISRGFMRDADLVVLDEPTASLDPMAEADVFRRFLAMAGGRTTIMVSHRLGSARMCDRILVLKEGRLVETGTHDELVDQKGEYARMWALQAGWYEG